MGSESTKDKIISSAFSFYKVPNFEKVSLSKIASRAGITKAAIYKHFKGREELEKSMEEKILIDIYSVVKRIEKNDFQDIDSVIVDIIVLMATHKEYIYYLTSTNPGYSIENLMMKLRGKGMEMFGSLYGNDNQISDYELFNNVIYYSCTMLHFQFARDDSLCKSGISDSFENIRNYAERLQKFIKSGLTSDMSAISVFRLATIDSFCKETIKKIPECDRGFKAISTVVEKVGFQATTVEAIANELGLVKSSLYSKFENKEQMIMRSIDDELNQVFMLIKENQSFSSNPEEKLYIMMQTELLYFESRPELFNVMKWLQFQSVNKTEEDSPNCLFAMNLFYELSEILVTKVPDLGFPGMNKRVVFMWFCGIPVFISFHGKKHSLPFEMMSAALKDCFYMMEMGALARKADGFAK